MFISFFVCVSSFYFECAITAAHGICVGVLMQPYDDFGVNAMAVGWHMYEFMNDVCLSFFYVTLSLALNVLFYTPTRAFGLRVYVCVRNA